MTYTNRLAAALLLGLVPVAVAQAQPPLRLISHAHDNDSMAIGAGPPALSADGNFVAFSSGSSDIVGLDIDKFSGHDVFVYDLTCRRAEIVSLTWHGDPPNGASSGSVDSNTGKVSISGDGRYVAFASSATNLVHDDLDTNGYPDVFLVDRQIPIGDKSRVKRISKARLQLPNSNGTSDSPAISADGRYVVFESDAKNLIAGDDSSTNVFRYRISDGDLQLVSIDRNNGFAIGTYPNISADGNRVIFRTTDNDLIATTVNYFSGPHVYIRDLAAQTNELVDRNDSGDYGQSGETDAFLALSGNGRFAAFRSQATNFASNMPPPQVFVRDTAKATLQIATANPGNATGPLSSRWPALDQDGTYLIFSASGRSPDGAWKTGLYRRHRDTLNDELLTPGLNNTGPQQGDQASVSSDGLRVAFLSPSNTLIAGVSGGGIFLSDARPPIRPPCYR